VEWAGQHYNYSSGSFLVTEKQMERVRELSLCRRDTYQHESTIGS